MIQVRCTCGRELTVVGVHDDLVRVEPCDQCMIPKPEPVSEKHILNKNAGITSKVK